MGLHNVIRVWLLALLAIAVLGCSGSDFTFPSQEPSTVGVVKEIGETQKNVPNPGLLRFLVEGERKLPSGEPGLAWVMIDDQSKVVHRKGKAVRVSKPAEIHVGQKVQVWFGGVEDSHPAQAYGRLVVIEGE